MSDTEAWTLHDLRRTLRTDLASLRVRDEIADACLGHGKRGLARIYNAALLNLIEHHIHGVELAPITAGRLIHDPSLVHEATHGPTS